MNSFLHETGGYHYSTEEMQQHPHPPAAYVGSSTSNAPKFGGSPFSHRHQAHRRSLSNPNDRGMVDAENAYYPPLVTHPARQVPTGNTNPFLCSDQQQQHVYHNPLVYGNNIFEEYSPSEAEDVFDVGDDDILSDALGRLGSGSAESGYHGAFQDTNPNSPLSSSASTNPRTPLKHISPMYAHQRTPSNLSNASSGSFGMNPNFDGDPGIHMSSTPLRLKFKKQLIFLRV